RGYAPAGGTYIKVATDALALMEEHMSNQRTRHGPSYEARWETYAVDGESAKAYAEARKEIAANFGRAHQIGGRYTADEFMTATDKLDAGALRDLGALLQDHSKFSSVGTTKKLKESNQAWAARVDASWGATLGEWIATQQDAHHKDVTSRLEGIDAKV